MGVYKPYTRKRTRGAGLRDLVSFFFGGCSAYRFMIKIIFSYCVGQLLIL